MKKIEREDLLIIRRHSNISEERIDTLLKDTIYHTKDSWQNFLRLFFMSLGIGFLSAGILFFFAYNWADLHKFVKIGMIEGLILIMVGFVLCSKLPAIFKNILLTGASILVGVLFAVFGQIYQTGANAYDFFLGWTVAITLWVFISNFSPLWLLYILLLNTTLILYEEQVALNWSSSFLYTLLFIINLSCLVGALSNYLIPHTTQSTPNTKGKEILYSWLSQASPNWFVNVLAIASVTFSTLGITDSIFKPYNLDFAILFSLSVITYTLGIIFGLKHKKMIFLAIIPFSIIIIISSFILHLSSAAESFFILSLFIIGSVSYVIKNLIDFQKKWNQ